MFWKPTVPVLGDVGTFMRDLAAGLTGYNCDPEWISTLRERDEAKEITNKKVCTILFYGNVYYDVNIWGLVVRFIFLTFYIFLCNVCILYA